MDCALPVDPAGGEGEVQPLGRRAERGAPRRADPGRLAEHGRAERQFAELEGLDHDPQRQFGQDRRIVRGGRCRLRHRLAQDFELAEFEPVDLQTPEQQRAAGPDQPRALEPEPGPVAIRQHDVADGGVG